MTGIYCVFPVLLALLAPTEAILGKISLLGALSGNLGSPVQGDANRPVVAVNNGGYGYGYGYGQGRVGYTGGYGGSLGGYQSGVGEVVKVIKVVIPSEQPQPQLYSGATFAGGYGSSWTPVQASLQSQGTAQTEAVVSPPRPVIRPVPPIRIPSPVPVLQPLPVQQSFSQPQPIVKTIKLIIDGGDSNQYGYQQPETFGAYKPTGFIQKEDC